MAVLAKRVDGTSPARISGPVEELGLLKRNLDNAEKSVELALRSG